MMDSDKSSRGTSLSQEQYDLIVTYLNTGIKPPLEMLKRANLYGKLNGGDVTRNCTGYSRFKTIVSRLNLRPSDGALIFSANGKVVIPNSMFFSAITDAHRSSGIKHLNMSSTMTKLTEKYTMGCRQFGISEDVVRVVVRSCRSGSCSDKTYAGAPVGVKEDHVNALKLGKKPEKLRKTDVEEVETGDSSVKTPQKHPKESHQTKTPPLLNPPATTQSVQQEPPYAVLEKLPNGNFIIKQIITKTTPNKAGTQAGTNKQSMLDTNSFLTPVNILTDPSTKMTTPGDMRSSTCTSTNNSDAAKTTISDKTPTTKNNPGQSNFPSYPVSMTSTPSGYPVNMTSTPSGYPVNMTSTPSGYPVNIPHLGSALGGNIIVLPYPPPSAQQNLATNFQQYPIQLPNNAVFPTNMFPHTGAVGSTRFAIPVNFIVSNPQPFSTQHFCNVAKPGQQMPKMREVLMTGGLLSSIPSSVATTALNLSTTAGSAAGSTDGSEKEKGKEKCPIGSPPNSDRFDETKRHTDDNNNVGLTAETAGPPSTVAVVDDDTDDDMTDESDKSQPMEVDASDETHIKYPFIWYNIAELKREKEPFKRINKAISDMQLDVQKSMRGDQVSMEKLKLKIEVVKQMVKAEKERTEIYKDILKYY